MTTNQPLRNALPYLTYAERAGALFASDGVSVADALAKAHLNYLVKDVPFTGREDTPSGTREVPVDPTWLRLLVRVDHDGTRTPLSVVGARYKVLQNAVAYDMLQVLVDDDQAKIVAAAAYGTPLGVKSYVAMHLPEPLLIGDSGDIVDLYLVGRQHHDGNAAFSISVVPQVRKTGAIIETDMPAFPQNWAIYHSGNLQTKIDNAAMSIKRVRHWSTGYQQATTRMLATKMNTAAFEKITRRLLPTPSGASDKSSVQWAERRRVLVGLFENVRGNFGAGTVYAAYAAVCQYSDMHASGKVDPDLARQMRVINGDTKLKRKAWQLLSAAVR